MLEPTVVARSWDLAFRERAAGEALERQVAGFLSRVSSDLERAGCTLIGHLKCLVAVEDRCLFLSVTRFGQTPRAKGSVPETVGGARLDVNAIVFSVSQEAVREVLDSQMEAVFGRAARGAAALHKGETP